MHSGRLRRQIGGLALLVTAFAAHASARPTVVELFTSEGCSSCPPAERYLSELAVRPDVLALSFHVEYWNGLGWRDPWAIGDFTARQNAYARRMGLGSVFTPQAIVDGHESYVGSDRSRIGARLGKPSADVHVDLKKEGGDLIIEIGSAPEAADILLLPFRRQVISHIGRGENQGRTLEESNVVRSLQILGRTHAAALELRVRRDSIPKDATDVAVLAQRPNAGEILGAARLEIQPDGRTSK